MFLNRKDRLEEDLERIRRANLPQETIEEEDAAQNAEKQRMAQIAKGITIKDFIAMIIAVFSIILPYVLVLFVLLGVFALIFQ